MVQFPLSTANTRGVIITSFLTFGLPAVDGKTHESSIYDEYNYIGRNLDADEFAKDLNNRYTTSINPSLTIKNLSNPGIKNLKSEICLLRYLNPAQRLIWHYIGYGAPAPTIFNELWIYTEKADKLKKIKFEQMLSWIGDLTLIILDCHNAGQLIKKYDDYDNLIILGACSYDQKLVAFPGLPVDIFSMCLTDPVKASILYHNYKSFIRYSSEEIKGTDKHRNTPKGDICAVFRAVTSAIAWDSYPRQIYTKYFRGNCILQVMLKNFLLAQRIMKSCGKTATSHPFLPDVTHHDLWTTWDFELEQCMLQFGSANYNFSSFFESHNSLFENSLDFDIDICTKYLPIVLQSLYSRFHRKNALRLIKLYMNSGRLAVENCVDAGLPNIIGLISPKANKELYSLILNVWAPMIYVNPSSMSKELVSIITNICFGSICTEDVQVRRISFLVYLIMCKKNLINQVDCSKYIRYIFEQLKFADNDEYKVVLLLCLANLKPSEPDDEEPGSWIFSKNEIFKNDLKFSYSQSMNCHQADVEIVQYICYTSENPRVRASAVVALSQSYLFQTNEIFSNFIIGRATDSHAIVRSEVLVAFSNFISTHMEKFLCCAYYDILSEVNDIHFSEIYQFPDSILYTTIWKTLLMLTVDTDVGICKMAKAVLDDIILRLSRTILDYEVSKRLAVISFNNSSKYDDYGSASVLLKRLLQNVTEVSSQQIPDQVFNSQSEIPLVSELLTTEIQQFVGFKL